MAAKPKKVATEADIAYLLEKADLAIKKTKKDHKKSIKCKECDSVFIYSRGRCKECTEKHRNARNDEKVGKRWFSTNGHEYTYGSDGKPVLYARYRMEQLLDRPLQEHEQVARLDGDKRNNADHNLILIAKPGINLLELKCECGRHYFSPFLEQQEQTLDQDM